MSGDITIKIRRSTATAFGVIPRVKEPWFGMGALTYLRQRILTKMSREEQWELLRAIKDGLIALLPAEPAAP